MGQANVDPKTGIRYGVISQHSVGEQWYENAEPEYGTPEEITCPECELEIWAGSNTKWGDEITCPECGQLVEVQIPDMTEPAGWSYEGEGYKLSDCLDTDIFVLDSPYYTFAQFCSPCVPGAGNLDTPLEGGVKCYCLGHDWFESNEAPYPVYRVSDNTLVNPKEDDNVNGEGISEVE